ncbi:hypothetical protein ACNI3Q_13015 [Sphingomonas sp. FW199]|uniref:hypothetical protein n=1 Tax=Sphingomonas sp. FW199 TaxID=3400217 RepID=UPI003CE74405
MKKLILIAAGLGIATAALPAAAQAQSYRPHPQAVRYDANGWQSINQRQANLYARISTAQRRGAISAREANSLRAQFGQLARLEAQYRRSGRGLTVAERRDLDRRFDGLSQRIRYERLDRDGRRG